MEQVIERANHSSSPARLPRTQMPMTRDILAFSAPLGRACERNLLGRVEGCLVPGSTFELTQPSP